MPDVPEEPDVPDVPDVPEEPDVPDVPEEPDVPDDDGGPASAASPASLHVLMKVVLAVQADRPLPSAPTENNPAKTILLAMDIGDLEVRAIDPDSVARKTTVVQNLALWPGVWAPSRMRFVFAVTLSLVALGCPLGGQSKPARAQEAALELNLNARFGRMELAAERVAPKARDAFFDKRKGWGSAIRVADYDMTGLRMQGEDDCETVVRVAWYHASENELRTTTLKQKWHDFKGDWKLTEETRIDGDLGLLGEPKAPSAEPAPTRRAQFPSITLGTGSSANLGVKEMPAAPPAAGEGPAFSDPPADGPR